ncbi:MAG: ABC transporter ATP-binding protein [Actinomycetia bacterium]|nr:ABC transporter ATP-binding protein [Actinomycetes bacterium]MCP4222241.1 ABC transporter ATP-binding protein [Actinomycetes bacterium]MCP5032946.1 ABC transporter ATP-binding protein [Actinomycetes bacterium]
MPTVTYQPPTGKPPEAQRPVLIQARGVQKSYGDFRVLEDVGFDVTGGITGLLGANGSGKTTLLGMILGLHPIDAGVLTVYGRDPWSAGSNVRTLTGYAPEHHTLPPDLRADDFVRHVAELHGLPRDEATTRASDALWLVGLGEERFRALGTMSTGQRQRVKLAQAFVHDPELILLDEPTDGLDPVQRDAMLELIARIASEFGINVLLSSHLLDEVEQICDAAVIIGEGRTLASGSVEELRGSGEAGVLVELDANPDLVAGVGAAIGARGFVVSIDGRQVSIQGDDDQVFDAARDACAEADIGIVRLSRRRLSLEDVFLDRLG